MAYINLYFDMYIMCMFVCGCKCDLVLTVLGSNSGWEPLTLFDNAIRIGLAVSLTKGIL